MKISQTNFSYIQLAQLKLIDQLFPFHFFLNDDNEIVQLGKSLKKLALSDFTSFEDCFTIQQPAFISSVKEVEVCAQEIFVLKCLLIDGLTLRGQIVSMPDIKLILFVGTPVIRELNTIKSLGLSLGDFAIFDSAPDYSLAMKAQNVSLSESISLTTKLKQKQQELAESNKALESFTYIASHDLKTPLRNILNFSKLLKIKNGKDLDDTGSQFLDFIIDAGTRMESLLAALLNYSVTNYKTPHFKQVNLNTILDNVLKDLHSRISENRAVIMYDELPVLNIDEQQIYQLFLNLLSNAIKFKAEKDPRIQVRVKDKSNGCYFEVQDNGIGISKAQMPDVFTTFKRLKHEVQYEGTGIGLSICKKIVENHGGEIWVKQNPKGGTVFCFTLDKSLPIIS